MQTWHPQVNKWLWKDFSIVKLFSVPYFMCIVLFKWLVELLIWYWVGPQSSVNWNSHSSTSSLWKSFSCHCWSLKHSPLLLWRPRTCFFPEHLQKALFLSERSPAATDGLWVTLFCQWFWTPIFHNPAHLSVSESLRPPDPWPRCHASCPLFFSILRLGGFLTVKNVSLRVSPMTILMQ